MKKKITVSSFLLMLLLSLTTMAQNLVVKTLDNPGSNSVVTGTFNLSEFLQIQIVSLNNYNIPLYAIYPLTNNVYYQAPLQEEASAENGPFYVRLKVTDSDGNTTYIEPYDSPAYAYDFSGTYTFEMTIDPFLAAATPNLETENPSLLLFGNNCDNNICNNNIVHTKPDGNGDIIDGVFGTNGTPITFTAEELAILNDANGRSFVMRQTATNATSVVNIPAHADAATIGQAIKNAGIPHTIYIQPEIQEDGSLEIYADEAFTLEGDEILSTQWQEAFGQNIALYPNPATDVLHLDYDTAKEIEYGIYNLAGQRVQTVKSKGTQHNLNVSELAPGMYVLEAMGESQKTHFRFVKN